MIHFRLYRVLALLCFITVLTVPINAETMLATDVVHSWYNLQLKLVKETPGFSPPVSSRAFGYTGVTFYEAIRPSMPGYQSLVGQLSDLEAVPQPVADYHWPAVANSALATITQLLFANATAENMAAIDTLYQQNLAVFQEEADSAIIERSVQYGQDVANAIFEWSMSDGGHEGYLRNFPEDYVPPVGAGMWTPTPRLGGDPQPALQPYWGNNRPLLPAGEDVCDPPPPPIYSEAPGTPFYAEVMEVYEVSRNLTDEQAEIARFWADDPGQTATPPGHTISILKQILTQENTSLGLTAEAYAKVGIAVSDAFIGCWKAKYEYNLVRPVTLIQQMFAPGWMPIVNTPPFPEYTSGHSVQTGAAAIILAELLGENYTFTDHTHDALGLEPRSFESFTQMAEETAISRLYSGIHYRAAIEAGIKQGECIGARVNTLRFHT